MIKTYTTVAQEAEQELDTLLGHENRIYKPWQLEAHDIEPIRLITTVDEMLMLVYANAYVRPHFEVDDAKVVVPSFFCKLNGAIDGFVADVKAKAKLMPDQIALYQGFQKINRKPRTGMLNKKPKWFDDTRGILIEEALKADIDSIRMLKPTYQRQYLMAINRVLDIVKAGHYTGPNPGNRVILETLIYNCQPIVSMLHTYDYQYTIPKFVIVDDHKKRPNEFAALRLLFMHALSFDVFVLSESGFSSIENLLDPNVYSVYGLTQRDFIYSEVLSKRAKLYKLLKWLIAAGLVVIGGLYLAMLLI